MGSQMQMDGETLFFFYRLCAVCALPWCITHDKYLTFTFRNVQKEINYSKYFFLEGKKVSFFLVT